ncbi:MAG: hypothetical protein JWL84_5035 [Rhodospirillales bacterium]|jgi:hypothetical protein|nr:hypothetical protein [Rhodospirillales bacterium]
MLLGWPALWCHNGTMVDFRLTPAEEARITLLQKEIEEGIAAQAVLRDSVREKQRELENLLAKKQLEAMKESPW